MLIIHKVTLIQQYHFDTLLMYIKILISTLKAPRKMHLKMSSAEVVCCKWLPNITGEFKYTSDVSSL